MRNVKLLTRAVTLVLLAAVSSGCIRMKVTDATRPAMGTIPAVQAATKPGRIVLHVASFPMHPKPENDRFAEAIRNRFRNQLTAHGFQVVDIAQAERQDPVLRVDTRSYSGRMGSQLLLSAFTLFIVPASGSGITHVDSTLLREGRVLGMSRQSVEAGMMISSLPLVMLYGGADQPATFEPHLELDPELVSLALQGGI